MVADKTGREPAVGRAAAGTTEAEVDRIAVFAGRIVVVDYSFVDKIVENLVAVAGTAEGNFFAIADRFK